MLRFALAFLTFLAASFAGAESNTLTGRPGFFKPTPSGDSSISKIVPADDAAATPAPTANADAAVPPIVAVQPPVPVRTEPAAESARKAEDDMDRAEREHREMTERSVASATSLQGAFTGLTGERDR